MKTKWIYIFLCCLMMVGMSKGQQAQDVGIKPEAVKPMADLEFSMQIQTLNEKQLSSFSQQAMQKIGDFLGYVQLMNDKTLDAGFRERAEQLATQAFLIPENFKPFVKKIPHKIVSPKFELITPFRLVPIGDSPMYFGEIKLLGTENYPPVIFGVFILKQPKQFGKEVNYVWEVKLGTE